MTQSSPTKLLLLVGATAIGLMLGGVLPAVAQEVVAEVETWGGSAVRLTQPSLDFFYTILPKPPPGAPAPAGGASMGGTTSGLSSGGAGRALPEPIQGRDRRDTLTLVRDGVEVRIPFDRIAALNVSRREFASTLPPYARADHAQYLADAVLVDGSRIDGATVSFGTTILRGTGPQGTIELPLEDVKRLKITR
jgi:hypothetical protein